MKVGIIGTGDMGIIHAKSLSLLKDVLISGCNDIVRESAEAFSRQFGAKVYDTAEDLLESDIDTIYICTRHDSHARIVEQAVRHQKAIFCEKPLAFTMEESRTLYQVVSKSDLPFTIGFNQRFAPAVLALRSYLRENQTKPTIINMSMSCVNFLDGWMGKPEQGGGIMVAWLCHGLDLLRHITGDEIVEVYCSADRMRLPKGYCEDGGVIVCKMNSGTLATISFHDHSPIQYVMDPLKEMVRIEMHTGKESLICQGHDKLVICADGEVQIREFGPYSQLFSWGYEAFNQQYIEALQLKKSLEPGIRDAMISAILVESARKSSLENRAVAVDYSCL